MRQWHATVSKDLRLKLTVMEVALQKLASPRLRMDALACGALSEDIDDELAALTTTNGRVRALEATLNKLMRALMVVERHSTREEKTSRAVAAKTGADESRSLAPEDLLPADDDAQAHEEVMKKWNNVEELWTGGSSSAKPSSDVARMREELRRHREADEGRGHGRPLSLRIGR